MIKKDKWFFFASGRKASSIKELKHVLESMEEPEFRHHVNNERNDFANWVESVFKETKLAHNMREVSEKDGLLIQLEEFLRKKKEKKNFSKKLKRLIIPKRKKITHVSPASEKELSEEEIKGIVDEAKQVFESEEKEVKRKSHRHKIDYHKFIVKEFVYGFVLGLIFGLIMCGIIFNLRV